MVKVALYGRLISIHSLRMEGDRRYFIFCSDSAISIHSLRMEGDGAEMPRDDYDGISIHSLRMEGDWTVSYCPRTGTEFQSTPSAWRETL